MPMYCAYHPEREPIGTCVECGRLVCVECKTLLGGKIYCVPCADKNFAYVSTKDIPKPAEQSAASASAVTAPETNAKAAKEQIAVKDKTAVAPAEPAAIKKPRKRNRGLIAFLIILGLLIVIAIIAYVVLTLMGWVIQISL